MKVRIVKRTRVDAKVEYVIQQTRTLLGMLPWWWVDAMDGFVSEEEARRHLCHFDGTKPRDEVVG